jgi:cyclopropane-fatty-acyl-phospholipid synthase
MSMLRHQIIKKFLHAFHHIHFGSIKITMPNGKTYDFEGKEKGPKADLVIHDSRAIDQLAKKGDVGFAEGYRDKLLDSNDLASLFAFSLENEQALKKYIRGSFLGQLVSRIAYLFNLNTIKGSKNNIHAHYDLGNDFYELWLDPSMTYSSAIFSDKTEGLTPAQYRKYDRIIENLNPSGKLLEIGCGWGGFAERALLKGDYAMKAITLSQQQYEYATNRLGGNAIISAEDYRIQEGKYNQIVSIEMFEAVGEKFWGTYFSKIKNLLAEKGRAIIQTITIDDCYFEQYRKSGDAIRTFIFPGGMLPSPERFIAASSKAGLAITDKFSFGDDYALTLQHWLLAFERKIEQIKGLGFDEKFLRIWRFYLTFCIASFKTGRTNVMQIALEHAG